MRGTIRSSIKDVMFYANDEQRHVVFWFANEKKWLVQCVHGVLNRHKALCSALTDMHCRTSGKVYGDDYFLLVPDNWTVSLTG